MKGALVWRPGVKRGKRWHAVATKIERIVMGTPPNWAHEVCSRNTMGIE